jgi:hypothetical protein
MFQKEHGLFTIRKIIGQTPLYCVFDKADVSGGSGKEQGRGKKVEGIVHNTNVRVHIPIFYKVMGLGHDGDGVRIRIGIIPALDKLVVADG